MSAFTTPPGDAQCPELAHLAHVLQHQNSVLPAPLYAQELRAISRSVAEWTWEHFTPARFSAIQRKRIQKRWAGHQKAEPWVALGVSRATYYRNQGVA